MKSASVASKPNSVVCPFCETGTLHAQVQNSMHCESCGGSLSRGMLETLKQIAALPDVLGRHACECGHPEMRRIPDGIFHCPACGSEVLPIDASSAPTKPEEHGVAYWAGWVDGRFEESGSFVDNPSLMKWKDPYDRLAYYQGHRLGSKRGGQRVVAAEGSKETYGFPLRRCNMI